MRRGRPWQLARLPRFPLPAFRFPLPVFRFPRAGRRVPWRGVPNSTGRAFVKRLLPQERATRHSRSPSGILAEPKTNPAKAWTRRSRMIPWRLAASGSTSREPRSQFRQKPPQPRRPPHEGLPAPGGSSARPRAHRRAPTFPGPVRPPEGASSHPIPQRQPVHGRPRCARCTPWRARIDSEAAFRCEPTPTTQARPGDGSTGGIRAATATDQGKASIDWTLITLRVRQRASRYSSPRMTTCLDLQPCKSRAGSSETRNARVPSSFRRLSSW